MSLLPRVLGLLLALTLSSVSAAAQISPEALRDTIRALLSERGVPGAQVVILRDGVPFVQVAYGFAHVDSARRVTPDTRFRVGSISKLTTATAALLLWEQGRLDLDAPISSLVPEFPDSLAGVTARRLAGHLGGVRHYFPRDFVRPTQRFDDVIAPLEIFAHDALIAAPGSRYHYSSYGYNLLGAAVERASGEPFRSYLHRAVFAPFEMSSALFERSDSAITDLAHTYASAAQAAVRTDLSDRWPSGGLLASAADIATFAERSVRGDLLSPRVRTLLFQSMLLPDGSPTNVGFGWRIGTDPAGRALYHHGGASIGGRAMLVVWKDLAVVVAITTNLSNARISEADAITLGMLVAPAP